MKKPKPPSKDTDKVTKREFPKVGKLSEMAKPIGPKR